MQSELWFKGPEFVRKPKEFWPVDISGDMREPPPQALLEEKFSVTQSALLTTDKVPTVNLENIIDPKRFSSFDKLLCITANVIRFVSRLYSKPTERYSSFPRNSYWRCDII